MRYGSTCRTCSNRSTVFMGPVESHLLFRQSRLGCAMGTHQPSIWLSYPPSWVAYPDGEYLALGITQ